MTDANRNADRLEALRATLKLEREAYARIRTLSTEQLEAARAGDTDRVVVLLGEKQTLVEEVSARADDGSRAAWGELRDSLAPEVRAEIERCIEEVAALLAGIVKLEDEARDEMTTRRGDTLEAMERLATARRVNRAYGGAGSSPPPPPQMTDQRG